MHELLTMTPSDIKPLLSESHTGGSSTGWRRESHTVTPLSIAAKTAPTFPSRRSCNILAMIWAAARVGLASIARDLPRRLEMEQRALSAERDVAVLEDRERIARDLHDRVIQRLFAAGLGVEAFRKGVSDPRLAERLERGRRARRDHPRAGANRSSSCRSPRRPGHGEQSSSRCAPTRAPPWGSTWWSASTARSTPSATTWATLWWRCCARRCPTWPATLNPPPWRSPSP